ncbi:MAG: hypothetical protein FD130_349, partial [Halothiobacillaceae bacterium]
QSSERSPTDTLNVTEMANLLNQLNDRLNKADIVDVKRVDAIRHEIAKGTYEVNPLRVAEKLFRFEQTLYH